MKKFKLSERQADSILDLKLKFLAKLEEMKISAEQSDLEKEKDELEKILSSQARLKSLVRRELLEDAEKYGDDRRTKIVKREEAKSISTADLIPQEDITVVLSKKGWIRSAKGHEINGSELTYKAGDEFSLQVETRTNKQLIFIDSTGRGYASSPHGLPSARSHGEPLTSRLTPPSGASFMGMYEESEDYILLCTDAGYGFFTQTNNLSTKNKNGKAALKVAEGNNLVTPPTTKDIDSTSIAVATNDGRLLIFPSDELAELEKGKGNKLINIPSAAKDEKVISVLVLNKGDSITIHAGKRKLILSSKDLKNYFGSRALRGHKLPKGMQKVTSMVKESK